MGRLGSNGVREKDGEADATNRHGLVVYSYRGINCNEIRFENLDLDVRLCFPSSQ